MSNQIEIKINNIIENVNRLYITDLKKVEKCNSDQLNKLILKLDAYSSIRETISNLSQDAYTIEGVSTVITAIGSLIDVLKDSKTTISIELLIDKLNVLSNAIYAFIDIFENSEI